MQIIYFITPAAAQIKPPHTPTREDPRWSGGPKHRKLKHLRIFLVECVLLTEGSVVDPNYEI